MLSCGPRSEREADRLLAPPPGSPTVPPPAGPAGAPVAPGLQTLNLGGPRPGLLYVPRTYHAGQPSLSLVVMLHGAGGDAPGGMDPFLRLADDRRLLLFAPASSQRTWDSVMGRSGPDVRLIDEGLRQIMAGYPVDRSRMAIEGFSDGASYALSLGLANGDLFTHVIAFSPGFVPPGSRRGRPRVLVAHGSRDTVLPIRSTSRRIVPELRKEGYRVTYREFDGPHAVPGAVAEQAATWFLDTPG
jgi:phospholipase/carboxylesterase